ncbi:unnamed protein product [Amoebophrya sp. A25]|nr:unnamed protein product [Amoebophrya sp. A25]|eukprot:GSA25T00025364001.1
MAKERRAAIAPILRVNVFHPGKMKAPKEGQRSDGKSAVRSVAARLVASRENGYPLEIIDNIAFLIPVANAQFWASLFFPEDLLKMHEGDPSAVLERVQKSPRNEFGLTGLYVKQEDAGKKHLGYAGKMFQPPKDLDEDDEYKQNSDKAVKLGKIRSLIHDRYKSSSEEQFFPECSFYGLMNARSNSHKPTETLMAFVGFNFNVYTKILGQTGQVVKSKRKSPAKGSVETTGATPRAKPWIRNSRFNWKEFDEQYRKARAAASASDYDSELRGIRFVWDAGANKDGDVTRTPAADAEELQEQQVRWDKYKAFVRGEKQSSLVEAQRYLDSFVLGEKQAWVPADRVIAITALLAAGQGGMPIEKIPKQNPAGGPSSRRPEQDAMDELLKTPLTTNINPFEPIVVLQVEEEETQSGKCQEIRSEQPKEPKKLLPCNNVDHCLAIVRLRSRGGANYFESLFNGKEQSAAFKEQFIDGVTDGYHLQFRDEKMQSDNDRWRISVQLFVNSGNGWLTCDALYWDETTGDNDTNSEAGTDVGRLSDLSGLSETAGGDGAESFVDLADTDAVV